MERYLVKNGNQPYKIVGIISLVTSSLHIALWLIVALVMLIAGSRVASFAGVFSRAYQEEATAYLIFAFLVFMFIAVGNGTVRILLSLDLMKEEIRSKGKLIFFIVMCILGAIGWLITMITGISQHDYGAFEIIFALYLFGWNAGIATALILKYVNLVPAGNMNNYPPQSPADIYPGNFESSFDPRYQPHESMKSEYLTGVIECIFGSAAGNVCRCPMGSEIKIGRDSSCDMMINHTKVSRVHCVARKMPDGSYQVTDYSSNGTFYQANDQTYRLQRETPVIVPKGALLIIGEADNILRLG